MNLFKKSKTYLRFTLIFTWSCVIFCMATATEVLSQVKKETGINLSLTNASVVSVIKAISRETGYDFFYEETSLSQMERITINVKNATLEDVLQQVSHKTRLNFSMVNDNYVVSRATEPAKPDKAEAKTQQNPIRVTGIVSDNFGELLPGVNVVLRGNPNVGANTDANGEFTLNVPSDTSVLQFRYIGYKMQEIMVGNRRILNVIMQEDMAELGEVVVVGFGKQKKDDLIGSVVSLNVADIRKVSSSNVTTMLAGNIAGMISYQRSGEPGADNADFFIRGVTTFGYKKDPLILIDGIEVTRTDLARLQPDDIANFSIMKDATSTAVYGARGANGVISITTKEGSEGKLNISVRVENAYTTPTKNIELADPITYMRLGNEAVVTRDPLGRLPYSRNKIDHTIRGTNKYVYPATDWYQEMFNDHATVQRVNLNASGGGTVARYYLAATFNQDNGNLKVDKRNNFNNNVRLRTYSFRSNINMNLTKTTEAALRVVGSFDDYTGPLNGGTDVYNQVMRANPVLFPPYYAPDKMNEATTHILFGNYEKDAKYINPYAEMVRGYKDYSRSKIDAQFELKQDLSFLTKGLSIRGLFNTSRYSYFDVQRFFNPYYYNIGSYDRVTDTYVLAPLNATEGTEFLGYKEGTKEVNSTVYIEVMGDYNRTFAERHTVSAMLVYILRNTLSGNAGDLQVSLPHRNLGLSGRATYSFRDKYYAEFNFGYNGSERFYKTERWGFFPSAGAAWTVSKEDFWQSEAVSKLKLRATYGLVGNDAIGSDYDRFFYLSNINMDSNARGARFGAPGSYYQLNGVQVLRSANKDITWEVARKTNIGFELGLFNKFSIEADYFREHRSRILMDRVSIPSTMGLQSVERANVGEARASGVDGSLDYATRFGKDFWIKARANFTYAASEFLVYEEPDYAQEYRKHAGHSLSQQWGLIAERLFIDDAEVANSPLQQYGAYKAGDIKYHDVSGDGKISGEDLVPIGYPTDPEIIYGFGISAGYRQLDFSCFFQGSARSSFWINPAATSPFVGEQQMLKAYADSHWSEDYRDVYALWPRLSSTINTNNAPGAYKDGNGNWQWPIKNTWFMRNGAFLRLKSMEIGYTLSSKLLQKAHLTNARVYLNGTNLLLFSGFKLWDIEMGGNGLGYPIQKSYNIGVTVSF